jgi:hypothetical protein
MNNFNRRKPQCPTDDQFERLSFDSLTLEGNKKRVQIHLQQCNACRKRFQEYDGFYSFFMQEISKPISNSVLDLAKKIGHDDVIYGLFACEPLPDKTNGHGFAYRTHLSFVANGFPNPQRLVDFNEAEKSAKLTIRFMTDPSCQKILLFVKSIDFYSFKNFRLSIPGIIDNAQLSASGATKMEIIDIKKMTEEIIYLQKDDTNSNAFEKGVEKVRNSIRI